MNRSFHRSQPLRYADCSAVEVKSKYGAEFRRFSVDRVKPGKFQEFYKLVMHVHHIANIEVMIGYADVHGDLLPINNDDNFCKAVSMAHPLLRVFIQRQEEVDYTNFGTSTLTRRKKASSAVMLRNDANGGRGGGGGAKRPHIRIGLPQDFRPVSSIIDVDILPESHRRVRLYRHGSDKPLGFYIRDGTSVRVTPHGLEKVPGIFISRMVPGGLAESTGLLAVNDEVLEVNGIEVSGKSLDQVTDMMIANSHNLIVTVKPVNQRNNVVRGSRVSGSSGQSSDSGGSTGYPSLSSATAAAMMGAGGGGGVMTSGAVGAGGPPASHGYADELESDEEADIVIESSMKRPSRRSNASVASVASAASRSHQHHQHHQHQQQAPVSAAPPPPPPVPTPTPALVPAEPPSPPSRPPSVVSTASFHSQISLNGSSHHHQQHHQQQQQQQQQNHHHHHHPNSLSYQLHRDLNLQNGPQQQQQQQTTPTALSPHHHHHHQQQQPQHHSSNPALRHSNGSLHKILSSLRTDPRHSLALPKGGVEEDGTVITL